MTRWNGFDLAIVVGLLSPLSWAISTPSALAGDEKNTERDKDAAALEGTWTVEVHDTHGKPASKEFLALEHQWVFTKDGITMKAKGGEGRKGTFRLDHKQDPKALDITLEPGLPPGPKAPVPEKEVLKCIYSLDGDTLKVCYGLSEDRPAAFKSTAERRAIGLVVLRRQPPSKEESGGGWRSVVYGVIDDQQGMLMLKANGYLSARAGKPQDFQFLQLWRFDPKTEKWSKVDLFRNKSVVIRAEKREVYTEKTDQELLALTREIALFWAEWKEDGRVVKSLLFSGPVQCEDIDLSPPPKGKIAACIPYPNRAEARFVPDPEIHCRE